MKSRRYTAGESEPSVRARRASTKIRLDELADVVYPFPWRFDPRNYSELYLLSNVTEAQIQADIVKTLKSFRIDAMPIDAGGRRARGALMGAAKTAGLEIGSLASVKTGNAIPGGFADLEATLAPSGRSLYIEVKAPVCLTVNLSILRPAGKPTAEQLAFLLEKHNRGALVLVAWAVTDVVKFLGPRLAENRKALG